LWEACLPPAEMGPSSSQSLHSVSSSAAGRPPLSREGTSSARPAGSFLQPAALPQALGGLSCGQQALGRFSVSPTHWARHLTAVRKLNEAEIEGPHYLPHDLHHATLTGLGRWKLDRSFLPWRFWAPLGWCCEHTANTLHNGSLSKRD